MSSTDTVKAGKVTLHRTYGGTIWFIDATGQRREFTDIMTAHRLFEAVEKGSGERQTSIRVDGTDARKNANTTYHEVGGEPWRHSYRED